MNITLDGLMSGPDGELDWHFRHWDAEIGETLASELYKADCLLFGRITYNGMMRHWQNLAKADFLSKDDMGFFCQVADCYKVVCSSTLVNATWKHSEIINGDIKSGVQKLKSGKGKNIIVYGSGQLVSLLFQERLIDQLQLWIHPVLIGKGKKFFKDEMEGAELKLVSVKQFSTGVVFVRYKVINST
jgi:dihydrofolate reductase